nr:hypothetical protein [Tanacetum cinerariifolium]
MVSSSVVEEPVDATANTNDANVGQTPTSPNVNPKPGTLGVNMDWSSYARTMIEVWAIVELKDTIVVFGHSQKECPKNLSLGMAKNLKKPCQAPRGVSVSLKVAFKHAKEYRPMSKKPTANISGNKKKGVEPNKEVDFWGDQDSEDEVVSIDNDMARSITSERVGFSTKILLEQWRDSYDNGDYDEDSYDDDVYEGLDIRDKIQDICDNLDIRVQGRRKK